MKESPRSKISAMTLTELLIASALIGVVITGALSADVAIRTWQKRIEKRTMVQMDLAMAMEQIVKDGKATIGTGTCIESMAVPNCNWMRNIAIIHGSVSPIQMIAFRQIDNDGNVFYLIYYQIWATGLQQYRIFRYDYYPKLLTTWSQDFQNAIMLNPDRWTFFRPPYTVSPPTVPPPFFNIQFNANGQLQAIEITLTTRPAQTEKAHPLTNPDYSLTTRFLPPGLSQ